MANKTITQLDAAQSLNDNMVIAVQDTNTTYKTTLADVKAYCGGGSAGDKYKVGDRVTDDSDNPVGTVSSIFTDGNGDRYAVVCLDGSNRSIGTAKTLKPSSASGPTPQYTDQTMWSATETATSNTQALIDNCTAVGTTSEACSFCRGKSFTINGITYYGQLPNIVELVQIYINRVMIDSKDPTSNTLPTSTSNPIWSSTFRSSSNAWSSSGAIQYNTATNSLAVIPVLEIPLED